MEANPFWVVASFTEHGPLQSRPTGQLDLPRPSLRLEMQFNPQRKVFSMPARLSETTGWAFQDRDRAFRSMPLTVCDGQSHLKNTGKVESDHRI